MNRTGSFNPLRQRQVIFVLTLLGIVSLSWAASVVTDFSFAAALESFPKALSWMGANFTIHPETFDILPNILIKLGDTILSAVMATFLAGVVGLFLALLISKTTRTTLWLVVPVRVLASFLRNIPIAAWAMILLFSFGQGNLTGFIALFLETLGFLVRTYADLIDEASSHPVEALRASGASWSHTIVQAVIPTILPQFLSWMLFMLENNIRSATLVGILTGSGIGFLFDLYYKTFKYPQAALVVLAIVVAVLILEIFSNALRRVAR